MAARVASRCSNPDCGAVTSAARLGGSGAINIGVAAHITAASPGGPRYDITLSPTERSAGENGIWLCQNCAKLIDSDVARYSVRTLLQWKSDAEHKALVMLRSGVGASDSSLNLALPQLDSPDSLLAFANTSIVRVGRDAEIRELRAFLETGSTFSWWLWTGPAGTGKSRLAIELCRAVAGEWHAGFLREDNQSALESIQPTRPTLVVVDYAAQRSEWLSDTLFRLSQRLLTAPVRVLVLERQARGTWWGMVQRNHRMEESFHIQASSYSLPRELGGLSRPEVRSLVKSVAVQDGAELSSTDIEDIADHAENIDPSRRPLFALVAAMDWLDNKSTSIDRDAALRRLIARADSPAAKAALGSHGANQLRNIRTLATALGGISAETYADLLCTLSPPVGLLPSVYSEFHPASLDDLLDGVRPDILGELYVLDRLAAAGIERLATMALLSLAWKGDPEAYRAFVERAAADHKEHFHLVDLLDAGDWHESPNPCARMAVDTIPLLQRSNHPALDWILSRLASVRHLATDETLGEVTVTAHFRMANLVLNEGDTEKANSLFTQALDACEEHWATRSDILNNRGITWMYLGDYDRAIEDFTTAINAPQAKDEARACALNNRADIYDKRDDVHSAIRDRTSVIELAETTYNRRFIALIRRACALWKQGDQVSAYRDIDSILATGDISTKQKMFARLQRAEWLVENGAISDARIDLNAVMASERNFNSVESRARELDARLQTDPLL